MFNAEPNTVFPIMPNVIVNAKPNAVPIAIPPTAPHRAVNAKPATVAKSVFNKRLVKLGIDSNVSSGEKQQEVNVGKK
jgi:hypothetical protein